MRFWALFVFLFSQSSYALIEINGEYGLTKQAFGANREGRIEGQTFSGALALYLFDRTAIELNYSQTETTSVSTSNNRLTGDFSNFFFMGSTNVTLAYSYGIGIRQLFAGRRARWRPSIALGYARQVFKQTSELVLRNATTDEILNASGDPSRSRSDSISASFSLDLKLLAHFSLRGSVRTIFRAFEFNEARDNMQYTIGFTWYP